MTALVVIRAGDLRRRIRISSADVEYAASHDASNAGLHAGDILTARALLSALLLPSGADAAIALADSYGPGVTAFVRKMNTLTRKLGMTATHFTNFDGLLSSDISTPGNLLKLGKAAMAQWAFRNVVKRKWYTLRAWPHRHHYFWRNTNLLLKRYPGVIGIKTGWTPDAGECLLFEATHHKKTLIGVVLDSAATNSGFTFVDAARLLNWGFGLHVPIPPPMPPPVTPKHAVGG
jgi:D-alanyl-D-alanine carboxypeptidase (penicillin-binding protein 5/6)